MLAYGYPEVSANRRLNHIRNGMFYLRTPLVTYYHISLCNLFTLIVKTFSSFPKAQLLQKPTDEAEWALLVMLHFHCQLIDSFCNFLLHGPIYFIGLKSFKMSTVWLYEWLVGKVSWNKQNSLYLFISTIGEIQMTKIRVSILKT